MDPANILPQLERLDDGIDNLEEALKPLLGGLPDVAAKLPLLDKAKLYVLVTYSIESMLFSSLRLNSVDAKEHPVFKELTRVRQYFEKIKNIENPPAKPEQTLNKEAAIRFIRSDLADDKEVNTKLSEMIAKEKAKAALQAAVASKKRKPDTDSPSNDSSEDGSSSEAEGEVKPAPAKKVKKEKKEKKSKKDKKEKKKEKKNKSGK
ncbi:Sas10/Utp3/C1D family-domain-containing protein [Xylariomycetidae sp. FL0641]|nr:Sas10/Utp3/C1D family-domain-containing protein [Xylariomycetidae sp. FL0641]